MQIRRLILSIGLSSALAMGAVAATGSSAFAAATPQTGVYGCAYTDSTPQISQGSTGSAVKEAQCLLEHWGISVGAAGVDGDFGPATTEAVKAFQNELHSACGLSVDGIVGPMTWHALKNPGC
jgi:peptidoglycan hydrolase-like protein with peptidoglycan-binding domain